MKILSLLRNLYQGSRIRTPVYMLPEKRIKKRKGGRKTKTKQKERGRSDRERFFFFNFPSMKNKTKNTHTKNRDKKQQQKTKQKLADVSCKAIFHVFRPRCKFGSRRFYRTVFAVLRNWDHITFSCAYGVFKLCQKFLFRGKINNGLLRGIYFELCQTS